MQKHALALGYFFLSAFCIFVGLQGLAVRGPMYFAASLAGCGGLVFLVSALSPQLQALRAWLAELWRLARDEEAFNSPIDPHQ